MVMHNEIYKTRMTFKNFVGVKLFPEGTWTTVPGFQRFTTGWVDGTISWVKIIETE